MAILSKAHTSLIENKTSMIPFQLGKMLSKIKDIKINSEIGFGSTYLLNLLDYPLWLCSQSLDLVPDKS